MIKTTLSALLGAGITQGAATLPHTITYPSPEEIMQMRLNARGIGEAECSQRASSGFCSDYANYWKDETPSMIELLRYPAMCPL